jgi:serine/threonine-protein kinase
MNDQRMIGHYRIVEVLGSGSMGMVLGAVDTFIERPVAIKSLRPELTQDPEFVSRFRSEAKSLALLNHPNITTLYSTMLEGSDLYMVMELVRGRPLDDILRDRGKPLGVKESLAIIAQAADGLSYAHDKGVIHRDIKPCNLMISNDGRVKIMDFGIARVRGSVRLTRVGTAIGTPLYMSPEQCRGAEGDERSDVYSLAIVLYEMLAGAPPFSGATEYELIQAQISAVPPPLVAKAFGVSPALESAIMKALAKKPEQRFPSMRAFSDALGATAMRIDATAVVRSAAHLLKAPQEVAETKTGTFNLVKSRTATWARRFKALHPALKVLIIAVAGAPLVVPFYFLLIPFKAPIESHLGRIESTSVARSERGAKPADAAMGDVDSGTRTRDPAETDKDKIAPREPESAANLESRSYPVGASQPTPPQAPSADSSDASAKIEDLRKKIKGTGKNRVKAADFDLVPNGVKVQLLAPAKSLAAAGIPEAQFVLGMLLLETEGYVEREEAFSAFRDAAKMGYPDAQANLGMMYQNWLPRTVTLRPNFGLGATINMVGVDSRRTEARQLSNSAGLSRAIMLPQKTTQKRRWR